MEMTWLYALVSTLIVSLISLTGVFLLSFKTQRLHRVLILLVCFSIGAMLGNSFEGFFARSFLRNPNTTLTGWLVMSGFLVFYTRAVSAHAPAYTNFDQQKSVKTYGYLSLYANSMHNITDGILIGGLLGCLLPK